MKPPQMLSSGSVQRLLATAEDAFNRKDFQLCIETLESASRRAPAHTGILLQLGRIYGTRFDYVAAERCFEKAIRLAPNKRQMLETVASHCEPFRNPQFVERYCLRALEHKDASPDACVQLSQLYERLRRLDDAGALVDRALTLNPAHPPALLARARLARLAGRLDEAERLIRSFVEKPHPDAWAHAQTWYELGGILDRQGRYDEAMPAFLEAKGKLRPQASMFIEKRRVECTRLKVMQTNITADMLTRWSRPDPALLPSRRLALLCGHPRSGTTLLEQVLDSHPDIVSADETDIFKDDTFPALKRASPVEGYMLDVLESVPIPALCRLRADYFRFMDLSIGNPIGDRLLLDKNPSLTFMIPAFIRVFPEAKYLVALRDPRDVCLSCFMQPLSLNPISASYLTLEGTAEEYANLMSILTTLRPLMASPFLEIRYEDMVEDLESVARKTLEFLGVPWDARVLGFDEHARKKLVRSPTYADVAKPVYKRAMGRWNNYRKYLEPALPKLEPFAKSFGYE
jgi:tetratricopeptide (TPR) repeat protein